MLGLHIIELQLAAKTFGKTLTLSSLLGFLNF